MNGCESWTIKKAEHGRIDAFELWCWKELLRVPWTARRSNQSILKEISPEYSLEGLKLKLKLQHFLATRYKELTHCKRLWFWERLKAGGEGDIRGWDGWMASLTQWTWVWVSSRSWWWTGRPGVLRSMGSQSRTWLGGWTELNWKHCHWLLFYILAHKIIVIDDAFKLMKYTTSFTERKKKPYKSKQITRQINISKMFNKI